MTTALTHGVGDHPLASSRRAVLSLTLGAFAIGTSEFMISGLLRDVATDLQVPIPSAGLLISGYAAGVAIGGPIVTMTIGRLDRKLQVILLLGLFVLGNLICAVAPSYGMLFVGRVVSAFSHGAFYGVASVVATILVPAEGRARALALVSVGVMVANVVGVPLGTALGQVAGWRTAFWGVCGLGAISAIALLACLPNKLGANSGNVLSQLRAVGRPAVLIGLLLSACFTVGLFVCFSYVTPLLTTVSRATPEQIPLLLVLFGAGATVGVLGGGRLASNGLATTIAAAFVAQILVYAAIVFLCWSLVAMTVLMFMLGLAGMLTVAPLRMLVINAAIDAPGLASTLTSSTFNLGVAIGAAIGAVLLQLGVGYAHLPIVGICFALGGLALVRVARLATSPSSAISRPPA